MMKEPASEQVRREMALVTRWMCVSDLHALLKLSQSTIRRALREEGGPTIWASTSLTKTIPTYKWMKVPGDSHGRRQWALAAADTTCWPNAIPFTSKKSKPTPASASVATQSSYGGYNLMCVPTTKPSLIKAVGDLVTTEFVPAQKKFSAHDVTKRLREVVLQKVALQDPSAVLVDSGETGTVWAQGKQISKIDHEDVKSIVHELFHVGALTGYDRIHTGQFFEYDLVANIAAQAPVVTATIASSPTTDPTTAVPAGTSGGAYDGSSTI